MSASIQNRLIKQARSDPSEVTIKLSEVNSIAEHMKATRLKYADIEENKRLLLAGKVRILNVPIRVLGKALDKE